MKENPFSKLLTFLQALEQKQFSYALTHHRNGAIIVTVSVPGERWEVKFLDDGSIEVEKFASNGEIYGEEALEELFERELEESSAIIGSIIK